MRYNDAVYLYLYRKEVPLAFSDPPGFSRHVWLLRDSYYRGLEKHLWPDCAIPDWRVVEVAIDHGIPPELALSDAVEKRFM